MNLCNRGGRHGLAEFGIEIVQLATQRGLDAANGIGPRKGFHAVLEIGQVKGDFAADQPKISISWKWSAAVYTTDMSDYNADQVKPAHTNTCDHTGSDHAGTPMAKKGSVIGGARGGGGSNYTGSWSGTQTVKPNCP